jgi:hypothetical protein
MEGVAILNIPNSNWSKTKTKNNNSTFFHYFKSPSKIQKPLPIFLAFFFTFTFFIRNSLSLAGPVEQKPSYCAIKGLVK